MNNILKKLCLVLGILLLAGTVGGCGKKKELARAATAEWGKVQDLCKEKKNGEAAKIAGKLRKENPVFKEAVYESVKNEPGYPYGSINWCSPVLGAKVLIYLDTIAHDL